MLRSLDSHWKGHARAIFAEVFRPQNAGRRIALDFDNTCIEGDTGELLHRYLSVNALWDLESFASQLEIAADREELEALLRRANEGESVDPEICAATLLVFPRHYRALGAAETYAWVPRLLSGLSKSSIEGFAESMLRLETQESPFWETFEGGRQTEDRLTIRRGIYTRPAFQELVRTAQDFGLEPVVVSASNTWTVQVAARDFGISPEQVLGNECDLRNGVVVPTRTRPATFRQGKVDNYLRYMDTEPPILAVGDSWTDFELLSFAEHAILVDRGDEALRKRATDLGWGIVPAQAFELKAWGLSL